MPLRLLCGLALCLLWGCGMRSDIHGFASYPGFATYFAEHPRSAELPTPEEQALLHRYRPELVLPPGHAGPIDFYRDYLPRTRMTDLATDEVLAEPPERAMLVENIADQTVALDLRQPITDPHPTVYGRVTHEAVDFPLARTNGESITRQLTFLSYHVPFAVSGLPARIGWLERTGVWLAEALLGWDRDDWHELDVYTAYTLVLDEQRQPFAVVLAQHNHHRSYLIHKDLNWPANDRLRLDVAERSNELYLASDDLTSVAHRTIPFSSHLDYLLSGEHKPWINGFDITVGLAAGGRLSEYTLQFLPPNDPFYAFEGWLGEYRPLWGYYVGRSGSPGADYYTHPALLPLGNTLKFAYLQDGDQQDIAAVRRYVDGWDIDVEAMLAYGGATLWADWQDWQSSPHPTAP